MSIQTTRSYLITSYYKLLSFDKIRFIVVGGIGFLVNYLGLTFFFYQLHMPIVLAQIFSAEAAVLATFIGNNFWAFTHHHHLPLWHKLIKFHLSAIMGLVINSSFVVLLVHYGRVYYGLALAVGSLAGLIWNYTLYKRFVFTSGKPHKRNASSCHSD